MIQEEQLATREISKLAQAIVDFEAQKAILHRVDGQIIGTGKSDFTQGNVSYNLECEGKIFQLIDVPGIEGDESRFSELVQAAVAKAHLVFFVNGTNKKPEKGTAEKICSYLSRGSNVCTLINVRGNADNYEFEEDRESLLGRGADITLTQTEDVLSSTLGEEVMLPGHCVQGLMGFASLACDPQTKSTTIHPSRESSLVRQQQNYLKYFTHHSEMYRFSRIDSVADVLKGKLSTYREDIVESNKTKVRELLRGNIAELSEALESHKSFISDVRPEFEKCREAIKEAVISFERISLSSRRNLINELFNALMDDSDKIVEEYFGEAKSIQIRIEKAFERHRDMSETKLEKKLSENIEVFQGKIEQSLTRLLEDVERVEFGQQMRTGETDRWRFGNTDPKGWNLGLGDFGSIAFQVGSYAVTGVVLGSPFAPPLGSIIGGAVGAAVGLIMAIVNVFMSKAKRIRKSQAEVRNKIDKVRGEKLDESEHEVAELVAAVRKRVKESVDNKVDELEKNLEVPVQILKKQIAMMRSMNEKIEKMPYGTTEAV